MIATPQFRACDVCRLVDYNCEPKECSYCDLCDAYICGGCKDDWPRRFRAALKRKLEPGYRGLPNYEEVSKGEQLLTNVTQL